MKDILPYIVMLIVIILIADMRYGFFSKIKKHYVRKKIKNGEAIKHFLKTFDLMEDVFGNVVVRIFSDRKEGENYVGVYCRHCGQKNRLTEGIQNSKCGACKKYLTLQSDEVKPADDSSADNTSSTTLFN